RRRLRISSDCEVGPLDPDSRLSDQRAVDENVDPADRLSGEDGPAGDPQGIAWNSRIRRLGEGSPCPGRTCAAVLAEAIGPGQRRSPPAQHTREWSGGDQ